MGALSAYSVPDITLKYFTYIFLLSSNNTSLRSVLPFADGETKKTGKVSNAQSHIAEPESNSGPSLDSLLFY